MTFTTIDPSLVPNNQINILDNAGFEIWQRGTTFVNPTGYMMDRWNISTSCTSYSVAQESTIIDSGTYSAKCVITTAAGGVFRIDQTLENSQQYVGKVVSFSMRVKSNVAGVKLFLSYIGGQTASNVGHSGSNNWETLTLTLTVPAAGLTFCVGFDSVNTTVGSSISPVACTFYIDSATMVYGPNPVTTFVPLPPQVDLARCQRFYEISGPATGPAVGQVGYYAIARESNTSNIAGDTIRYQVTKRVTPTMTGQVVSAQLEGSPTIGNLAQGDTGNWSIGFGVGNQYQVYTAFTRSSAQTVSNVVQFAYSWTASADL